MTPSSTTSAAAAEPRLFRVVLPVADIDRAAAFYGALLGQVGRRISPGRHYFRYGGVIVACVDPAAERDAAEFRPNPDHVYFSVDDPEAALGRARSAGARVVRLDHEPVDGVARKDEGDIQTQPWGERSFYCADPFGNNICFVQKGTEFTGR